MYKVAVIDDEEVYLNILRKELKSYELMIDFTFYSDPLEFLKESKDYDGLITDFEMPSMSAFMLFEELNKLNKRLEKVVITNYDNHVFTSFSYDLVWFLKKSEIKEQIPLMIEKLISKLDEGYKKLELKTVNCSVRIPYNEISHIQSDKNYILIHCNEVYRIRSTFNGILEKLTGTDFVVPVYGTAVNMEFIKYVNKTHGIITLLDETVIPISNGKKKEFMKQFKNFKLQ